MGAFLLAEVEAVFSALINFYLEQQRSYKFGKEEKLKKLKQIEELFGSGKSFVQFPIKIIYAVGDAEDIINYIPTIKVGVSASKRQFKKAVDRNRVKRLLREAYRLNKHIVQEAGLRPDKQLSLFFIYLDKTLPTFALLEEKMKSGLNRLVKTLKENT